MRRLPSRRPHSTSNRAVFLDKDGTLVANVPYNVDPERIRLLPGVAEGLRLLHARGYRLIVISNQPGVAQGFFPEEALGAVEERLWRLFARVGVPLAGFYYCPHHPAGRIVSYTLTCSCRKPNPGLIERAAQEHAIEVSSSWVIGDILDDIEAGRRAGCRTVFIDNGGETEWVLCPTRLPHHSVTSFLAAARLIVQVADLGGADNHTAPFFFSPSHGRGPRPCRRGRVMPEKTPWLSAERILCVRLDTIGDVLMTTPAVRALKESAANRHMTLLTSSAGAAIAPLIPEIDDVIIYDSPWMKATAPRPTSLPEYVMADSLRQSQFDAAVIFTVYSQNPLPAAFLCYLADIPLRLAHCHENPYQLLTHWVPDPEPHRFIRHEVRRQLDLAATVGCRTEDEHLSLRVPRAACLRVQHLLSDLGIGPHLPWVVIHPGATAPSRRYPPEGFATVARRLATESECQILFTGTGAEREVVDNIQTMMGIPSYSLVNQLDLGEMAALLALAPVLVANNTGPVHIAAAVGTPVVDLYALTNPQHTPWAVPHRVLFHDVPCKYCYKSVCPEGHHHCLRLVTPDTIYTAACELLATSHPKPRIHMLEGEC